MEFPSPNEEINSLLSLDSSIWDDLKSFHAVILRDQKNNRIKVFKAINK